MDETSGDLKSDPKAAYIGRPHVFLDGALSAAANAVWTQSMGGRKGLDCAPASASTGTVNGLRYRWWPVDHSIPGACGYAIETSAGWVAYTGDIRFHGKNGAQTQRFAEELATLHPVALLCEGTHTGTHAPFTEAAVMDNALPLLARRGGHAGHR